MSRGVTQHKIPMHQASSGASQPHLCIPTKPIPMTLASAIAAQGHHAHHAQMICGANCKRYRLLKKNEKTPYPGLAGPWPSMVIRPPVYCTSQEAVEFIRAKNEAEMKKKSKKKDKKKTKAAHKNIETEV